jgi:hypothetical protein
VRDDDEGGALGVQLAQQGEDARAGGRVEVAGRLVGEDHRRPAHHGAGDGHPLALPTGQLLCPVMRPTVSTHIGRIFAKLELRDRVQAVILGYECGLVPSRE